MLRRCYNKKYKRYHKYGGIGITVHQPWIDDIMIFKKFVNDKGITDDMLGRGKDKYNMYRIDSSGNYEPDNIHFVSANDINKTHGLSNSKLYDIWKGIKQRCYNTHDKDYKNYGARGIRVHQAWLDDFKVFYDYLKSLGIKDDMLGNGKLTIDRIRVNGNYEPGNVRFTTGNVQARNTRLISTLNITGYRGVSYKKSSGKYLSDISVDGKNISLARTTSKIDAARAYNDYVTKHDLEHTKNNLDINRVIIVSTQSFFKDTNLKYSLDGYYTHMVAGILTKLLNGTNPIDNKMLNKYIEDNDMSLLKIRLKVKELVKEFEINGVEFHYVVEKIDTKITIYEFKLT